MQRGESCAHAHKGRSDQYAFMQRLPIPMLRVDCPYHYLTAQRYDCGLSDLLPIIHIDAVLPGLPSLSA